MTNYSNSITLSALADELSSIIKEAVNVGGAPAPMGPAPYAGGVKNFVRESASRGWNTGGGLGKALVGLGVGYSLPGALSEEDPSGQGRSRLERVGEMAGNVGGGIIGSGMGENIGNMITRKLDPTDKYMTNASHVLENQKFEPMMRNGSVRTVGGKVMDSDTLKSMAERKLNKQIDARAGAFVKGNRANWAKFKLPRWGLSAIPGVLGIAGAIGGTSLGESLMGLPFKGLRKQVPQEQAIPQEQPMQTV